MEETSCLHAKGFYLGVDECLCDVVTVHVLIIS